ncbi:hypothetical protein QFZ78_000963 [Paenibacillus sp. V4I5]|nr:hypothetical protein [Paenibacillus sp. V4I5]
MKKDTSKSTISRKARIRKQNNKTPLKPVGRFFSRQGRSFIFHTIGSQGFERRLNLSGVVNSSSKVFVSICEIGLFNGRVLPFQGAASMEVHNVVPHDDGIVIVRGFIGWPSNLSVRLSVLVV